MIVWGSSIKSFSSSKGPGVVDIYVSRHSVLSEPIIENIAPVRYKYLRDRSRWHVERVWLG